ncbi:MAG: ROK family protein [Bacteroidales bacterium]|jgi:glucokinase|nr:ROK family protein [Bacteroidales bacterium]
MYPHAAAIGADIGRSAIRTAVVRYDGKVMLRESFPLSAKLTRHNIISSLQSSIWRTRELAAMNGINPLAVGLSVPGFIDHDRGIVLGPDHGVKGWKNVPLASLLHSGTGFPVYAGNDANLMTIAEHRFGRAKGYRHVIFVALRRGIGGGIIIDGRLYRGVNNTGGEIGMMIIDTGRSEESVKGRGTLEDYASAGAMVKRYLQLRGEDPAGSAMLRARTIFGMSEAGDPLARMVVNENARYVGIGLANIVSIFAPEIIVLGGGMALAGDHYLNEIKSQTKLNSLSWCAKGLKIEKATLGDDAAVAGAAWYALERLDGRNP